MPEIDRDLFQVLALALLLIAVLVLLAMLSALSRVNKLLQQQLTELKARSTDQPPEVATSATEFVGDEDFPDVASDSVIEDEANLLESSPGLDEAAAEEQDEPVPPEVAHQEPALEAPAHDEFAASSEPASTSSEPGLVGGVDPFTGESAEVSSTPAEESDPFGAQPVGAANALDEEHPFETGAADSGTAAGEEEEQPFEKDGRWYFKRDEELLVYDESTGDWVGAEPTEVAAEPTSSAGAASGISDTSGSAVSDGSTTDTEQFDAIESLDTGSEAAQEPAAAGGFWKCPSCGAVNGSTASTCRMCFAARP